MTEKSIVPVGHIERTILVLRGHRVLLDADLSALYGVETRRLNEQVKRNIDRFPDDFMFQLTEEEYENLKSQIATSSSGWGGKRKIPFAFTEHGALMAASVLNSPKAVEMSIFVVRAFVRLRQMLQQNTELARKLAALERKYDTQFKVVFDAIRELMTPPAKPKHRIGFRGE
jgi:hypothetical protein